MDVSLPDDAVSSGQSAREEQLAKREAEAAAREEAAKEQLALVRAEMNNLNRLRQEIADKQSRLEAMSQENATIATNLQRQEEDISRARASLAAQQQQCERRLTEERTQSGAQAVQLQQMTLELEDSKKELDEKEAAFVRDKEEFQRKQNEADEFFKTLQAKQEDLDRREKFVERVKDKFELKETLKSGKKRRIECADQGAMAEEDDDNDDDDDMQTAAEAASTSESALELTFENADGEDDNTESLREGQILLAGHSDVWQGPDHSGEDGDDKKDDSLSDTTPIGP